MKRDVTAWEPTGELFGDEFVKDVPYTNWRPAGTKDWLLIYTCDGGGYFTNASGSRETQAGDVILYAPNELQDYATSRRLKHWNLLWVHFLPKVQWQPWLRWPKAAHGLRFLHLENGEVRGQFENALRRMIRLSRRKIPGARDLAENALEEALLWANVVASQENWMDIDPRIRKAIDRLSAHLQEVFSLEKLARHCGVSLSHFAALFKKNTGSSPQQFFEKLRMQHARQLLQITTLSIAEIARETGYEDPFYFSNRFRRFAGKSPSEFRREQHASPPEGFKRISE